jgi:selenocysteine-specific elongation factor
MLLDELALSGLLLKKVREGKAVRSLISLLAEKRVIVLENGRARLPEFTPKDDEAFRKSEEALFAYCRRRAFQPPTLEEARTELKMDPRAFSLLVQSLKNQSLKNARRLVLLSGEFLLTDEVENDMMEILKKIKGDVTLAAVRDATNSSRKFILPILEYFDSRGYTRRVVDPKVGDVRVVKGR